MSHFNISSRSDFLKMDGNTERSTVFLTAIMWKSRNSDNQASGYKPPYCCHFSNIMIPQHHPMIFRSFHLSQDIVLPAFQKWNIWFTTSIGCGQDVEEGWTIGSLGLEVSEMGIVAGQGNLEGLYGKQRWIHQLISGPYQTDCLIVGGI